MMCAKRITIATLMVACARPALGSGGDWTNLGLKFDWDNSPVSSSSYEYVKRKETRTLPEASSPIGRNHNPISNPVHEPEEVKYDDRRPASPKAKFPSPRTLSRSTSSVAVEKSSRRRRGSLPGNVLPKLLQRPVAAQPGAASRSTRPRSDSNKIILPPRKNKQPNRNRSNSDARFNRVIAAATTSRQRLAPANRAQPSPVSAESDRSNDDDHKSSSPRSRSSHTSVNDGDQDAGFVHRPVDDASENADGDDDETEEDREKRQQPTPGNTPVKKFPTATFVAGTITTLGTAGCYIGQHIVQTGTAHDILFGCTIGLAVVSVLLWIVFTKQCAGGRGGCCKGKNF